jgi:hypothetical protein
MPATTIMGLENVLDQVENWQVEWGRERGRDPQLYWLKVFGDPDLQGPVVLALRWAPCLRAALGLSWRGRIQLTVFPRRGSGRVAIARRAFPPPLSVLDAAYTHHVSGVGRFLPGLAARGPNASTGLEHAAGNLPTRLPAGQDISEAQTPPTRPPS